MTTKEKANGREKIEAPEPAAPAKKRGRPKREETGEANSTSALKHAERMGARIDAVLAQIATRKDELLEAQRKRPDKWPLFAQLVELEERLQNALDPQE